MSKKSLIGALAVTGAWFVGIGSVAGDECDSRLMFPLGGAVLYPTGHAPIALDIADLNGDGAPEIATTSIESALRVFVNDGDGAFVSGAPIGGGAMVTEVRFADLDGDGAQDVVLSFLFDQAIGVRYGNGDGTFGPQTNYDVLPEGPDTVRVTDFDGDGVTDLVVTTPNDFGVQLFRGVGDGTFAIIGAVRGTAYAFDHDLGDFNGDGHVDIVLAVTQADEIGIALGNGDGTFQALVTAPAGTRPSDVRAGDLDGDGDVDLVTLNSLSDDVSLFFNDGSGAFAPETRITNVGGGSGVNNLVLFDVDGDGALDIATTDDTGEVLVITRGNGDGTFSQMVEYSFGADVPAAIGLADLDGNGRIDFAVSHLISNQLGILLNDCNCSGDFDASGVIDFDDLLRMLTYWGDCATCPGDLTTDQAVSIADVIELLSVWGECE